jgi:hypothetical protein
MILRLCLNEMVLQASTSFPSANASQMVQGEYSSVAAPPPIW